MKYVTASLATVIVIASVAQASAGGFGTTGKSLVSTGNIVVAPSVDLGKVGVLNGNSTSVLSNVLNPAVSGVLSNNDGNSLGILSGGDGKKPRRH